MVSDDESSDSPIDAPKFGKQQLAETLLTPGLEDSEKGSIQAWFQSFRRQISDHGRLLLGEAHGNP
jgi:hypothetical protein